MRHHIIEESDFYKIALLTKSNAFNKQELVSNYVVPLNQQNIPNKDLIAFTLQYNDEGKAPVGFIKEYLSKLLPALNALKVSHLYVADTAYFKTLTGVSKAEPQLGYALPCKIKNFEHMTVVLGVNYLQLIYNPELQNKLNQTLTALASSVNGTYVAPGNGIIHFANYPENVQDIAQALENLHQYPTLTCDIEAFSLRFNKAGIGTIAFAWDEHNGVAFACDCMQDRRENSTSGYQSINAPVRTLLLKFFSTYQGNLIFHNANYDVKVIVYSLWMKSLLDTEGMLEGLQIMTRKLHDTKIMAYLATNSTAGNVLGLKALAHEFAGNWAVDVKDITKVSLDKLLEYNLVDALCTQYLRKKYEPVLWQDKQVDLYRGLMLDSVKLIIQLELTGMPMSRKRIVEVKTELETIQQQHLDNIQQSTLIKLLNLVLQTSAMQLANAKLKVKQHPLEKFNNVAFNPNSGSQLQRLLYEQMKLPVIDKTDTGMPATGADTLEKLINHTNEAVYKELIAALIGYGKVSKILNTFIPAFEQAINKDGTDTVWLHGSFNLGGTVSGRLSSSDPNLQNLPANSEYGKLIKSCFMAPKDWLFCGADFSSLEDMISALTTKDKNKLAVYVDGFDGHCLRAAYYFREQCPEIDMTDPVSVNSIKKKYPNLRQDSKAPTFLLTYGGTYHGMMSNLGWDKEKSLAIEKGYHNLYKESDEYIQQRLKQASFDGYVEVAFGLRLRTPLLSQVMFGGPKMPYEASAEGRTAGNALGQSYGLLNNRAAIDFMNKVRLSKYALDIKPVSLIHDAIYVLIRNDPKVLQWANIELVKSMQWQELPELQHPTVKLGSALDIFYPDWANPIGLPNEATLEKIESILQTNGINMNQTLNNEIQTTNY